jgi:hypothetical protein
MAQSLQLSMFALMFAVFTQSGESFYVPFHGTPTSGINLAKCIPQQGRVCLGIKMSNQHQRLWDIEMPVSLKGACVFTLLICAPLVISPSFAANDEAPAPSLIPVSVNADGANGVKKGSDSDDSTQKERGRKVPAMQSRLKSPLVPQSDKCGRGFRYILTGGSAADPPRAVCIPESLEAADEAADGLLRAAQREARDVASDAIQRARAIEKASKERESAELSALARQQPAAPPAPPASPSSGDTSAAGSRRQQQDAVEKERRRLEESFDALVREADGKVAEAKSRAAERLRAADEKAQQLLEEEVSPPPAARPTARAARCGRCGRCGRCPCDWRPLRLQLRLRLADAGARKAGGLTWRLWRDRLLLSRRRFRRAC